MVKFLNKVTTMGRIMLCLNFIALVGALILHRYDGLPFMALSTVCAFLAFRK